MNLNRCVRVAHSLTALVAVLAAGVVAPASAEDTAEIDPKSLSQSGSIAIHQYSVAWLASGTLGKGTLSYDGRKIPFRIGGLGVGGFGVASVDAKGTVYNIRGLDSFTGTYGNARLGVAVADKGQGRTWLKNTEGVVLELWTDVEGLALRAGVDGLVIEWESDVQEGIRDTQEGAEKAMDAVNPFD